jgi:hypothetical protein
MLERHDGQTTLAMYRSEQPKHHVHDLRLALRAKAEPAFLEHLQHWDVVWQNLCDQFLELGTAGNRGEMVQQCRTDTLPLVLVDDRESHLSLPGLDDDVTSAADNHWLSAFVNHCNQGLVIDEVDVQVESNFTFRKAAL